MEYPSAFRRNWECLNQEALKKMVPKNGFSYRLPHGKYANQLIAFLYCKYWYFLTFDWMIHWLINWLIEWLDTHRRLQVLTWKGRGQSSSHQNKPGFPYKWKALQILGCELHCPFSGNFSPFFRWKDCSKTPTTVAKSKIKLPQKVHPIRYFFLSFTAICVLRRSDRRVQRILSSNWIPFQASAR